MISTVESAPEYMSRCLSTARPSRANMKLIVSFSRDDDDDETFAINSLASSEPCSPDSGFSSDDGQNDFPADAFNRSKTLPSALRKTRSRSKQSVKRVRFADSLGLDLENHQYFVNDELLTNFDSLKLSNYQPTCSSLPIVAAQQELSSKSRFVLSNFPFRSENEYNDKARCERVCVAALRAAGVNIVGQVNLLNLAFNKSVIVRYTMNGWKTQNDTMATYSHRIFSADDIDAFNFTITLPPKFKSGKCEFCVKYSVDGAEYWDNNNGENYVIDVLDPTTLSPEPTARTTSKELDSSISVRRIGGLPSVPSNRINLRNRRWGKSIIDSDDESSLIYIPSRRKQ